MKETITKSDKSLEILNKLVIGNFYYGTIDAERFELSRKRFLSCLLTNNYRIIGVLNNQNKFELSFDFKYPIKLASKAAMVFGILISIILMIIGNWILPMFVFLIPFLIIFIGFNLKGKKEIDLFTSKFLEICNKSHE